VFLPMFSGFHMPASIFLTVGFRFTFRAHQAVANGTITEVTMMQVATNIVAQGAMGA
jgi:hypothetical protein